MEPRVIRQGDYLLQLAHAFGFDADAVWNDPQNEGIRRLRSDHNILAPGDVLYIPEQASKDPDVKGLTTGATNSFVSNAPTVKVSVQFSDAELASQACVLGELPDLTGLMTDVTGTLTLDVPVTLSIVTVKFTAADVVCVCALGNLDPIDTVSGVYQRLQTLGYIDESFPFDPDDPNLPLVRAGLRALRSASVASGPDASVTSGPSSTEDDGATDGPPSDASPSDLPAAGPASSGAPDGSPQSTSTSDDYAAITCSDAWQTYGLNDDGSLDDETSKLLRDAHGC